VLGNLNCGTERKVKNRADLEKSIQEANVRVGQQCHRRRKKRGGRRRRIRRRRRRRRRRRL